MGNEGNEDDPLLAPCWLIACDVCGAMAGELCRPPKVDCGCQGCAALLYALREGLAVCGAGDRDLAARAYQGAAESDPRRVAARVARLRAELAQLTHGVRTCRACGCTDLDCSKCIERTGEPCYWVAENLCSACQPPLFAEPYVRLHRARQARRELDS